MARVDAAGAGMRGNARAAAGRWAERADRMRACFPHHGPTAMIELNPVRQRIADLNDRVVSLRGYL